MFSMVFSIMDLSELGVVTTCAGIREFKHSFRQYIHDRPFKTRILTQRQGALTTAPLAAAFDNLWTKRASTVSFLSNKSVHTRLPTLSERACRMTPREKSNSAGGITCKTNDLLSAKRRASSGDTTCVIGGVSER
jgi:hypothetical protein